MYALWSWSDGGKVCDHISEGTFGGEPSTSRRYHLLVLRHRDGISGAFEGLMAGVLTAPDAGVINRTSCLLVHHIGSRLNGTAVTSLNYGAIASNNFVTAYGRPCK